MILSYRLLRHRNVLWTVIHTNRLLLSQWIIELNVWHFRGVDKENGEGSCLFPASRWRTSTKQAFLTDRYIPIHTITRAPHPDVHKLYLHIAQARTCQHGQYHTINDKICFYVSDIMLGGYQFFSCYLVAVLFVVKAVRAWKQYPLSASLTTTLFL